MSEPIYLTIKEVAELLRVSPDTLYRLVRNDASFPVLRVPGRGRGAFRFHRERVLEWCKHNEQGAAGVGVRVVRSKRAAG